MSVTAPCAGKQEGGGEREAAGEQTGEGRPEAGSQ